MYFEDAQSYLWRMPSSKSDVSSKTPFQASWAGRGWRGRWPPGGRSSHPPNSLPIKAKLLIGKYKPFGGQIHFGVTVCALYNEHCTLYNEHCTASQVHGTPLTENAENMNICCLSLRKQTDRMTSHTHLLFFKRHINDKMADCSRVGWRRQSENTKLCGYGFIQIWLPLVGFIHIWFVFCICMLAQHVRVRQ